MNILLWVLQVLAAFLYGASGVMKVFMFDKVSEGVPSFGALPREAWMALGILELVCAVGLIVPAAFHWHPALTVVAATVLAIESLVFVGVHIQYREITPIILSVVLGLLMAFIAYGRMVLNRSSDRPTPSGGVRMSRRLNEVAFDYLQPRENAYHAMERTAGSRAI